MARLARVLIAVALLAGWQAALVHPLEHLDEHGAFVHLEGDLHGHPDKSELCDALAALTACATHASFAYANLPAAQHDSPAPRFGVRVAEAPPFLAQGPPPLL